MPLDLLEKSCDSICVTQSRSISCVSEANFFFSSIGTGCLNDRQLRGKSYNVGSVASLSVLNAVQTKAGSFCPIRRSGCTNIANQTRGTHVCLALDLAHLICSIKNQDSQEVKKRKQAVDL